MATGEAVKRLLQRLARDGYTEAGEHLAKLAGTRGPARAALLQDASAYLATVENYHEEYSDITCPNCEVTYTLAFTRPPRTEAEAQERQRRAQFPDLCPPCARGWIPIRPQLLRHR